MTHDGADLLALGTRLMAERGALTALSDAAEAEREPVALDQQSVGRLSRTDAMLVQEMTPESERRRQQGTSRIDTAIARIDRSEYGLCARCGEAILKPRLDADPATSLCTDCARGAGS